MQAGFSGGEPAISKILSCPFVGCSVRLPSGVWLLKILPIFCSGFRLMPDSEVAVVRVVCAYQLILGNNCVHVASLQLCLTSCMFDIISGP